MKTKWLFNIFFFAGAITMLIMSMHYFQLYLTGVLKNKPVSDELWYHITLRVHILFGIVAIFLGPLQFSKKFRQFYLKWHKRVGYVYVLSVFVSSIAGVIVAQFAMGGIISTIGFSILSIIWFVSTFLAIQSAMKKNIRSHQKWMIRSFALTFSSIPQRLMLLLALTPYVEFLNVYRLSAWASWILNLLIAEFIIKRLRN